MWSTNGTSFLVHNVFKHSLVSLTLSLYCSFRAMMSDIIMKFFSALADVPWATISRAIISWINPSIISRQCHRCHLNWHKIVTYLIMSTFSMKTPNLTKNNCLLLSDATHVVLQDHLPHWTKHEGEGVSLFKFFTDLGKIWKCNLNRNFPSLLWIGDQILNQWMNWEKLCMS